MVSLTELWLPIVLSAVVVFVASSIAHMVLTYHRSNYRKLANETATLEALRKENLSPGAYMFPYCGTPKDMKSPETKAKFEQGPVGMLTVLPSGPPAIGKNLVQWFVFCLVMGIFVAYIAGRTLAAGADYLAVFRVAGAVAFVGYGVSQLDASIWRGQLWGVTSKFVIDGLVYALLTAGTFGWLWPR